MEILREDRGIKYQLFDLPALDDMVATIAEAFYQSEPMSVTQGLLQKEIANFIKPLGFKAEQESLTIIARSQDTDEVVGALLSDDFAAAIPDNMPVPSNEMAPILTLLDELDTRYKQGKSLDLNEYLHLSMLAVKPQYRGKKIAQNLVELSLENGVKKGYQRSVTTATGVISQHIFRQFGFVECMKIPYKTFMHQGSQVFKSLEGNIILMDKILL